MARMTLLPRIRLSRFGRLGEPLLACVLSAILFIPHSFSAEQFPTPIPDQNNQPVDRPASRPAILTPTEMAQSLADLAKDESSLREAARLQLMGMNQADLDSFRNLVRQSLPLSPAQNSALREIVLHVYAASLKPDSSTRDGFLGVRLGEVSVALPPDPPADRQQADPAGQAGLFGPPGRVGPATTAVVILERMSGFCGERAFLDGDIVLSILIDGEHLPVRTPNEMRNSVMQFGAGQSVEFVVLRQGQMIRVSAVLDPRPDAADPLVNSIQKVIDDRKAAAEVYWLKEFAPLLKEKIG